MLVLGVVVATAFAVLWISRYSTGSGFQAPGAGLEVLVLPIVYAMMAAAYLVLSFILGFLIRNIYVECAISIIGTCGLFYWIGNMNSKF